MKSLELPYIFEYCQLPERAAIPTFCSSMQSPSSLYLTKPDVLDNIKPTDISFGRGK